MQYKVLLVDDEPIILTGIKYLIDWEAQECEIVGTARNGQQALECIRSLEPDIVLCDIRMPVKSGLELLEECNRLLLPTVFIMLTNYQDFDFVRQTLRLQATDYLLKTQLEPQALITSLNHAKEECMKRGFLAKGMETEHQTRRENSERLRSAVRDILELPQDPELCKTLKDAGVLTRYAFIRILMDPSELPALASLSRKEHHRLMDWVKEFVDKLAGNLFSSYLVAAPDYDRQQLTVLLWGMEEAPNVQLLCSKLQSACRAITQTRLCLLCGSVFPSEAELQTASREIGELFQRHYLCGGELLTPGSLKSAAQPVQKLNTQPILARLTLELRGRNSGAVQKVLREAEKLVAETPHGWEQGVAFCKELYHACSMALYQPGNTADSFFSDTSVGYLAIQCGTTREHLRNWIALLSRQVEARLEANDFCRSTPAERAKQYVLQHAEEKITLQDAAEAAGLSPNYFSALFKREFQKNFMDFVNETKMQRACELIRAGNHRIYEISYMLGYENAYYFTRVFRKHIGMTPTEYQNALSRQE